MLPFLPSTTYIYVLFFPRFHFKDPYTSPILLLDKPSKPGTPSIADYDNESADIRWAPSASDGGSPITHYIVQQRKADKGDWEFVDNLRTPTGNEALEMKVVGLVERTKVQFRVIAVNKGGESEPSDPSPTHTVKHRKCKAQQERKEENLTFDYEQLFLFQNILKR